VGALQSVLPARPDPGPDGDLLLDYTTNGDVDDLRTPLSHAALIVDHLSSSG